MMKRHAMRKTSDLVNSIVDEGHKRNFDAAELFNAFAQVVANRNPKLARESLEAVEQTVMRRIPFSMHGETMPINGRPVQ